MPAFGVGFPGVGVDVDGVGDHKCAVEAYAELTDEVFIGFSGIFKGFEEFF